MKQIANTSLGADVNARMNHRTPLHYTCAKAGSQAERADTRIVQLLLAFGADVRALDNHGRTPADLLHKGWRHGP